MKKRKFTNEFDIESVKLVREQGLTTAQSAADLGVKRTMTTWVAKKGSRMRAGPWESEERRA